MLMRRDVGVDNRPRKGTRTALAVVVSLFTLAAVALVGPPAGATIPTGTASVATADAKIVGSVALAEGMVDVAGAGDVNGDGYDDLIVGSPFSTTSSFVPGAAWVVYGPMTRAIDVDAVGAKLTGEVSADFAGETVAGPGDINGDGFDDVLVGAPGNDSGGLDAGAVYVVLGPVSAAGESLANAEAKIEGVVAHDGFGSTRAMAGAGDVDGDGLADVIIGESRDGDAGLLAGAAFVFFGYALSGVLTWHDAGARILGTAPFDAAGSVVAGIGDVNNDGYDDLAVSAPHNWRVDNVGAGDLDGFIYIVDGPVLGSVSLRNADARLHGERVLDLGNVAIDGAGDVNGDGFGDLLIGANGAPGGASSLDPVGGITYVEFGPITGQRELSAADVRLTGEATGDALGWGVAGVGDTNGDGGDDFITSAFDADAGGHEDAGAAYLFLGNPADTTPPTVVGVPDRAPNANGWYRAPVTIDWQATDDSGHATDPPDTFAAIEGNVLYGSDPSCDPSNNCGSGRLGVAIDLSNPLVTCNAATFVQGQPGATVTAAVTDGVSGPAAAVIAAPANTARVGSWSVSLTGVDQAGRTTTVSCSYQVIYAFTGFFAPVSNPPAVNSRVAGILVPVRFALNGNQGSGVVSNATVTPVDCSTKAPLGVASVATISRVAYSPTLGQYAFLWATVGSWRGTCRLFVMNLRDGTSHGAYFRFR